MDKLLRVSDVLDYTGFSEPTLKRAIKSGHFPKPIKLSKGLNAWTEKQISEWIDRKVAEAESQ